jgi:hypothetical protein
LAGPVAAVAASCGFGRRSIAAAAANMALAATVAREWSPVLTRQPPRVHPGHKQQGKSASARGTTVKGRRRRNGTSILTPLRHGGGRHRWPRRKLGAVSAFHPSAGTAADLAAADAMESHLQAQERKPSQRCVEISAASDLGIRQDPGRMPDDLDVTASGAGRARPGRDRT